MNILKEHFHVPGKHFGGEMISYHWKSLLCKSNNLVLFEKEKKKL